MPRRKRRAARPLATLRKSKRLKLAGEEQESEEETLTPQKSSEDAGGDDVDMSLDFTIEEENEGKRSPDVESISSSQNKSDEVVIVEETVDDDPPAPTIDYVSNDKKEDSKKGTSKGSSCEKNRSPVIDFEMDVPDDSFGETAANLEKSKGDSAFSETAEEQEVVRKEIQPSIDAEKLSDIIEIDVTESSSVVNEIEANKEQDVLAEAETLVSENKDGDSLVDSAGSKLPGKQCTREKDHRMFSTARHTEAALSVAEGEVDFNSSVDTLDLHLSEDEVTKHCSSAEKNHSSGADADNMQEKENVGFWGASDIIETGVVRSNTELAEVTPAKVKDNNSVDTKSSDNTIFSVELDDAEDSVVAEKSGEQSSVPQVLTEDRVCEVSNKISETAAQLDSDSQIETVNLESCDEKEVLEEKVTECVAEEETAENESTSDANVRERVEEMVAFAENEQTSEDLEVTKREESTGASEKKLEPALIDDEVMEVDEVERIISAEKGDSDYASESMSEKEKSVFLKDSLENASGVEEKSKEHGSVVPDSEIMETDEVERIVSAETGEFDDVSESRGEREKSDSGKESLEDGTAVEESKEQEPLELTEIGEDFVHKSDDKVVGVVDSSVSAAGEPTKTDELAEKSASMEPEMADSSSQKQEDKFEETEETVEVFKLGLDENIDYMNEEEENRLLYEGDEAETTGTDAPMNENKNVKALDQSCTGEEGLNLLEKANENEEIEEVPVVKESKDVELITLEDDDDDVPQSSEGPKEKAPEPTKSPSNRTLGAPQIKASFMDPLKKVLVLIKKLLYEIGLKQKEQMETDSGLNSKSFLKYLSGELKYMIQVIDLQKDKVCTFADATRSLLEEEVIKVLEPEMKTKTGKDEMMKELQNGVSLIRGALLHLKSAVEKRNAVLT